MQDVACPGFRPSREHIVQEADKRPYSVCRQGHVHRFLRGSCIRHTRLLGPVHIFHSSRISLQWFQRGIRHKLDTPHCCIQHRKALRLLMSRSTRRADTQLLSSLYCRSWQIRWSTSRQKSSRSVTPLLNVNVRSKQATLISPMLVGVQEPRRKFRFRLKAGYGPAIVNLSSKL